MQHDDQDPLFAPEDHDPSPLHGAAIDPGAWPVLVVDDDEEVHIMTRLVLSKLRYKDRPLELLIARSAREAEEILRRRNDLAVALVDIVMETDDAGLRLARRIREDFGNEDVRIVLRTGQPGQAPVRDVILNYDINDYKSKTELTSEKLFITIITALRSFDNIRSARAAESANRLKSSFLATMSHEIRTPMNGVLGMLELLSHSSLSTDQQEMLDTARLSAGTLLRIIDDILDFSKIEAGRMDIERQPLDVGAILESVADTVAPTAQRKGVDLQLEVDPAIPARLLGDPVRLRQVLFNLSGNAIKFTDTGHVRLRATAVPGAAEGSVRVRVEVTDTGIGIPESIQSKLFQPFTQAELSTSRRFGGTGLGLSISRRLVELMQGEIGLQSSPGQGSTFWFWLDLPVCGGDEGQEAAPQAPAATARPDGSLPGATAQGGVPSLQGRTVLVAEDQMVNQMVIRRQLSLLGVGCEVYEDGVAALAAWRSGRFDMVLTDCNMPEMDGFELTGFIRREEAGSGRRTPVIALTANAIAGEDQRCLAAGMDGFLSKPVNLGQLHACLLRWIGGSAEAEQPAIFDPSPTLELFGRIDDGAREFLSAGFIGSAGPLLESVRAAFAGGDLGEARHAVHALAGVAKTAGAQELGMLCSTTERLLRSGDAEGARRLAGQLEGAFDRVRDAVRAL